MLPFITRPPISQRRKALALTVAGGADLLQIILLPTLGFGYVLDDFIDIVTAILLTAICGFKWQFVLAFFAELIPGLDILPTWSAVALLIPSAPTQIFVTTPNSSPTHPPIDVHSVAIPPVQRPPAPQLP